jgi:predicted permease
MRLFSKLPLRLRSLFRKGRVERDLTDELQFHLEESMGEKRANGMTSEEARYAALRELGGMEQVKEECRDMRQVNYIDDFIQDLRYGLRMLAKNPGFTAVAVLTLALGIGANTAIFSVIDTLMLCLPRFQHPDRLVCLIDKNPKVPPEVEVNPSPGNFLDWREQARSFDDMAAWRNWYFTLSEPQTGATLSESLRGVRVSPTFFSMLGVKAALGRVFRREEEEPGHDQVVVLSDGLWKRRFAADRTIVGRKLLIDGRPFSVIGILASDFQFYQSDFEVWMPLSVDTAFHDRGDHSVMVFARLAPGVSIAQAQTEMEAMARRLGEAHPDTNAGWSVRVVPLFPNREVRDVRPALLLLLGAAGVVLLIASANVANLLLARAVRRQREITIRAAIGATRGRLIRQMLTESILLATIGSTGGLLLAPMGVRVLIPLLPHAGTNKTIGGFRAAVPALDGRVLGFSLLVAVVTGVVFSLIPAFRTTRIKFLRVPSSSLSRPVAGHLLMMAEIALSIVLLVGAGLLLESFWRLQRVDPGFRPDHLLTMQVWLSKTKYPAAPSVRGFWDQVVRRIEGLAGVRAAGAVSFRPFLGMGVNTRLDIEGRAPQGPDDILDVAYRVVTPGYLHLLGQPLLRGRDFEDGDGPESAGVAVINEAMARRFWPNQDPIGEHIRPGFSKTNIPWGVDVPARWLTIVGVAGDIKEFRLNGQPDPELYISYRQFPSSFMFLIVRTAISPESLANAVQNEIRAVDAEQPVSNVRTMDEAISNAVPRFNLQLLSAFAALALLLSAAGVHGVTSYAVSMRTREIGVRMALGARRIDVLAMVVREGCTLAAIGVVAGVVGALWITRTMATLLYDVAPTDATAFTTASIVVFGVALVACYLPARRATKVDPTVALRYE